MHSLGGCLGWLYFHPGGICDFLLDILACPKCRLRVEQQGDRLVCGRCGRRYRIEDGIPIMLLSEAEPPADAGGAPKGESRLGEDAAPSDATA